MSGKSIETKTAVPIMVKLIMSAGHGSFLVSSSRHSSEKRRSDIQDHPTSHSVTMWWMTSSRKSTRGFSRLSVAIALQRQLARG